jgi:hypothetical protein
MSRTYRRCGQRHDYDRVLRDYDWGQRRADPVLDRRAFKAG